MMIASIIPMTAGLLLDICGAFMILRPFLYVNKTMKQFAESWIRATFKGINVKKPRLFDLGDHINLQRDQYEESANLIRWGFIFLAIGFFLILIASWINYLDN